MSLTEFLTGIADAIRAKKGTTEPIPAADFAAEIASIEGGSGGGGGEVIEPVLTALEVTENGVYIPGEGIDGYSQVTVEVPSVALERGVVVNAADANGNWTDVVAYGVFPASMFKGNTYLQKIVLVGITSIPANAFDGCTALSSLTIPEGVTSIGNYAFRNCTSLLEVSVPASVTSIGTYAFYGCTKLTSVVLNQGLKTIGDRAFQNCTALTSVSLPDGLTSIGDTSFGYTGITEVSIPASLTRMANYAFGNCAALKTVYWNPVSLSSVASYNYPPFNACPLLTDFIIADGVKVIPANILCKNTGLVNINIPESVTTIGGDAFNSCTKLESVDIPASVTSVGVNAFYGCTSMTTVYWNPVAISTVGSWSYPPFNACSALVNFVIGEEVTALPTYLLHSCTGIQSIVIPDSVKTIGGDAFNGCPALVSVQIGETADCAIASIGNNAFASCGALTDITIYTVADSVSGSPWGASSATITWAVE